MSQPFIFRKQIYSLIIAIISLIAGLLLSIHIAIIQVVIFYFYKLLVYTFAPVIREKLRYPLLIHTMIFISPYLVPFIFVHYNNIPANNLQGLILGVIISSVLLLSNFKHIRQQFSPSNYLLSFGIDRSEFYNSLISISISIIVEELFFRYLMISLLSQAIGVYAIFISAILFTHSHYINRWANVKFNLRSYIYQFVIGILLGMLFYYQKSIVGCIVSHFIFNLPTYIILLKRFRNTNEEVSYFRD